MHKSLLLLGLLQGGPLSGHALFSLVRSHGELYRDLKRGNVYALLAKMAGDGLLRVRIEHGTRGRLGERHIYSVTATGRARFRALLNESFVRFEPGGTSAEVAATFLQSVSPKRALKLLQDRVASITESRAALLSHAPDAANLSSDERLAAGWYALDHMVGAMEYEIRWTQRLLAQTRKDLRRARSTSRR